MIVLCCAFYKYKDLQLIDSSAFEFVNL